ncbi:anaerobic sulfatase maturase (plasmid) [Photobacterium sp. DA100]|uniref:anaerobic sulfatase maturase n=1 Tax=Photobacterium sp. DA100 TaxID=3027472 RepID=UPI00247A694D|nr:anaerobic sulfatase maturase [Photobacterium sp. DA100]WEM45515.1 anaerobic sulfatase maturase [Photobacterium sp. DA100]
MYTKQPTSQNCYIVTKPTGAVCNLDCSYCFYLEKEKLYPDRTQNWKMDDETLEKYIIQLIEAQSSNEVTFAWQGGEPTLMGIAFFEKAVSLQAKHAGKKKVSNVIQTNGVLIDEKWCKFLKDNDFLVGISIDGPAYLHDHYRINRSGKGTYSKVVMAIEKLRRFNIPFNTLTVVSAHNVDAPLEVYRHLKELGAEHLQFIPLVERESKKSRADGLTYINPDLSSEGLLTEWSVSPQKFGKFLNTIFDTWISEDVGKIFVQMFEVALDTWFGHTPSLCIFSRQCGHSLALEANGDLYNCDHYVFPEHKLGNIHINSIKVMNSSKKAIAFGQDKELSLSQDCLDCTFRNACNGGCPKHRFALSSKGKLEQNYLCPAYKSFFHHSAPYLRLMYELYKNGEDIRSIMAIRKQRLLTLQDQTKRNAPCFCGSGKKYKKCCSSITI